MKKKTKLTSFSNDFVNKMCAVIDKQQKKNKKKRGWGGRVRRPGGSAGNCNGNVALPSSATNFSAVKLFLHYFYFYNSHKFIFNELQ